MPTSRRQKNSIQYSWAPLRKFALWLTLGFLLLSSGSVLILRWLTPPTSAFMLQNRVKAWKEGRSDFKLIYQWTDWERISPQAAIAVVAAEDQKFPDHYGFDRKAIETAWDEMNREKRQRGASTISQQVAKNLFLWPGRSFVRKGLEAYFTVLIELFWPKRRILEMYLNICELGDGVYGVAPAAKVFFKSQPASLSLPQAALLAAVLPNPKKFRVDHPSAYITMRQGWIMKQTQKLGGTSYLKRMEG